MHALFKKYMNNGIKFYYLLLCGEVNTRWTITQPAQRNNSAIWHVFIWMQQKKLKLKRKSIRNKSMMFMVVWWFSRKSRNQKQYYLITLRSLDEQLLGEPTRHGPLSDNDVHLDPFDTHSSQCLNHESKIKKAFKKSNCHTYSVLKNIFPFAY